MHISKQRHLVGDRDRWLSVLGGSALVFAGLRQRSIWRPALAAAGADLVFRGLTGAGHVWDAVRQRRRGLPWGQGIKVRRSVTINKPPEELYRFWHSLENLPRIMSHLESVTRIDDQRSHWRVKAPAGATVEWDAEVISDRTNEIIGWRSLPGAQIDNAGSVRFERAPGGRGTIVRVQLQYNPPGGRLASLFARLFGEEPDQQLQDDLCRFKSLMETGEIPSTEAQPSGRESSRRIRFDERTERDVRYEPVETASEMSFPASDPPAWNTGRI